MKNYLPLGTVVRLKNGTKRIMIYGRRQIQAETGEMYDYVACFYPEGNISPEYTFLFNGDSIEEVIFEGFSDEENDKYVELLNGLDEPKE